MTDTAGYPLIRFSVGYGINGVTAENVNIESHRPQTQRDKNGKPVTLEFFSLRSEVTESITDILFSVSIRPEKDYKILNVRVGKMWNAFRYTTVMPQTLSDGSAGGSIVVESEERYTVVPLSLGASITTPIPLFQIYADIIYAWAWMNEVQRYTMPDGAVSQLPETTYHTATIGFRTGFGIIISITKKFAVTGDWGYRGLGFYNFSAQNGRGTGLDYSISGAYGTVGLSLGW